MCFCSHDSVLVSVADERAGALETAVPANEVHAIFCHCNALSKTPRRVSASPSRRTSCVSVCRILAAAHSGQPTLQADLDAVAKAVQAAHAARVIVTQGSLGIAGFAWKSPTVIDVPLHACAIAIERLLFAFDCHRIHNCAASDCDVYFIDTSKGHRRQWCSMKNCGNREKQKRWRSVARRTAKLKAT